MLKQEQSYNKLSPNEWWIRWEVSASEVLITKYFTLGNPVIPTFGKMQIFHILLEPRDHGNDLREITAMSEWLLIWVTGWQGFRKCTGADFGPKLDSKPCSK